MKLSSLCMLALPQIAVYLSYASALTNLYDTFNVTEPIPDQTYHINDTVVIQWTIIQRGLPRLAEMNIFLVPNNATVNSNYTVGLNTAQGLGTQQYWEYTIPSNITFGSYQLEFVCRERQNYLLVKDDITHIPIRIVQAVPPTHPAFFSYFSFKPHFNLNSTGMKSDNLTPAMASEANKSSVSIPSVIAIPPTPVSGLETEANDYMVPETPVVAVSTASGRHETIVPSIGKGDQLLSPTVADDAASTTSSHHSHFRSPSASHILGKLKKKRSRSESISSQKSDASEFFYEATNEKLLDDLQVHYAHLGKHVRDVRIVSPPPEAPKLKAFQSTDENGKTTTRWGDYARVRLQHVIDAALSNQVDDAEVPFSLSKIRSNTERLYTVTEPLHPWVRWLRKIYRWENRVETGFWLWVYICLWYYDMIIPFICGIAVWVILYHRVTLASLQLDAIMSDEVNMPAIEKETRNGKRWFRRKQAKPQSGYAALEKRSLVAWRQDIYHKYGPKAQMMVTDFLDMHAVDKLEMTRNLVTWKRPYKSRMLLIFFLLSGLIFSIIPSKYQVKWIFSVCGFEFFVLMPLRSHYPRYRRLFSIIDWFLWDVPNDSEFALEIIRKRHRSAEMDSEEIAHRLGISSINTDLKADDSDIDSIDADSLSQEPLELPHRSSLSSSILSPRPTQLVDGAGDPIPLGPSNGVDSESTGGPIQDSSDEYNVPASVSKVSLMTRLTKINSKNKDVDEKSMSKLTKVTTGGSEMQSAWRATYRAIPGRVIITGGMLQFRTTRVAGARVLVDYDTDDIVRIRKTKSIDLMLWHSNGLSLDMVDGEVSISVPAPSSTTI
ncbi:hypothetical protein NQZ79_g7868 [Umbelopsis isabellina]|nr:hypothetical protein NQZ79_g7868 [Umbelopsis isabellina]